MGSMHMAKLVVQHICLVQAMSPTVCRNFRMHHANLDSLKLSALMSAMASWRFADQLLLMRPASAPAHRSCASARKTVDLARLKL